MRGEDRGVEQLEPIALSVACATERALVGSGSGEEWIVGEPTPPEQCLGDAVGEEGVGAATVDLGEERGDDLVDRCITDRVDAAGGQMGEGVQQVGSHVGVDEMPGEGVGEAPSGEVRGGERFDGGPDEREEFVAEVATVADYRVHRSYSDRMRSVSQWPSWTMTR